MFTFFFEKVMRMQNLLSAREAIKRPVCEDDTPIPHSSTYSIKIESIKQIINGYGQLLVDSTLAEAARFWRRAPAQTVF
jgi:hypothetical protein